MTAAAALGGGVAYAPLGIPTYRPPPRCYFVDLPSPLDSTHVEVLEVGLDRTPRPTQPGAFLCVVSVSA